MISEPSTLVCFWASFTLLPRSLPAKSMKLIFPCTLLVWLRSVIVRIACDLEDWSFIPVWLVILDWVMAAYAEPVLNDLHERLDGLDLSLREIHDVHVFFCIDSNHAAAPFVQQVVCLLAVYFVKRNPRLRSLEATVMSGKLRSLIAKRSCVASKYSPGIFF